MESQYLTLLSLIVFLPAAGALALAFFPKNKPELIKLVSLFITVAVFLITLWMAMGGDNSA